jgi:hypothetical protein
MEWVSKWVRLDNGQPILYTPLTNASWTQRAKFCWWWKKHFVRTAPSTLLYPNYIAFMYYTHTLLGIFLFTTASRTALGSTQPPTQWVPGDFSLGVEQPGRKADHSPPSSAEIKEWVGLYFHSPNTPTWRGALLKHRDIFTFTFTHTPSNRVHLSNMEGSFNLFCRITSQVT